MGHRIYHKFRAAREGWGGPNNQVLFKSWGSGLPLQNPVRREQVDTPIYGAKGPGSLLGARDQGSPITPLGLLAAWFNPEERARRKGLPLPVPFAERCKEDWTVA